MAIQSNPMIPLFALQLTAQELGDQIRTQVRDQIRSSQNPDAARKVTISTPDGKTVTITNPESGSPGTITVPTRDFIRDLDMPPRVRDVSIAFFIMLALIIVGTPITRAFARMIDRKSQQPQIPQHVTAQLTQLTQAVDAIAIEVERISEGQRFATKLLSEQQKTARPLPGVR